MSFEVVVDIFVLLMFVVFVVGFIDLIVGGGGLIMVFVLMIVGVLLVVVLVINKV